MAERLLAEVPLDRGEVLRITRDSEQGHAELSMRRWFVSASGELRPGREGLTIRPGQLVAVMAALEAARLRMTGAGAL